MYLEKFQIKNSHLTMPFGLMMDTKQGNKMNIMNLYPDLNMLIKIRFGRS